MDNLITKYLIYDQTFFRNDSVQLTNGIRRVDQTKVQLKKIHLSSQTGTIYFDILKEISKQQHHNIVNVLDIYYVHNNYSYIVIENCSNNLLHYFQNNPQGFNSEQIFSFMKQITRGYQQLIEQGILHRNLTPENIYYIENQNGILYKIGGFEQSKILDDRDQPIDDNTKVQNENYYFAPELSQINDYSFKADIFSFGLILLEMATKQKLQDKQLLKQHHLQNLCNLDKLDNKLKELLCKMIVYEPQERLSWSHLIKNLFYEIIQAASTNNRNEKAKSLENGQNCFIKIIQKPKKDFQHYLEINSRNELQINRKLRGKNHPNVVQIYEVLHEPENSEIYIIMEDCNGDLRELIELKQFNFKDILDLASQINKSYQFLEEMTIIHRDIKPENILFKIVDNKIQYKITDFGISRMSAQGCTKCGTQIYTAPEVKGNCQYTNKCDIYSFGIVLYYIATNKQYPFDINQIQLFYNQLKEKKSIEYPNNLILDDAIKSLINKMIIYEANERITWGKEMEQFIQIIVLQNQVDQQLIQQKDQQSIQQQKLSFLNQNFQNKKNIIGTSQFSNTYQNIHPRFITPQPNEEKKQVLNDFIPFNSLQQFKHQNQIQRGPQKEFQPLINKTFSHPQQLQSQPKIFLNNINFKK